MTTKTKLTPKIIATFKLSQGETEKELYDTEITGFGIRIRERGNSKFIFRYRIGGVQRRMSLGPATAETTALARENACKLAARVALGDDPALDKETAQQQASALFGPLVQLFLERHKTDWVPRYYVDVARHLNIDAKSLHKLPVAKVTQSSVTDLLDGIAKNKSGVTANRVRASLSKFYSWVLSRGIELPKNPVEYTETRSEQSRKRVLTNDELRAIWHACPADHYGGIVKLLMLTGQRREEIAALRCSEITDARPDLPKGQYQIEFPDQRTKNGEPHVVPLTDEALAILDQFPREDRICVFGRKGTGFSGWSHCKDRLDQAIAANGKAIAPWILHDLRRTMATRMAEELEVQPHIIEAVLNHISGHKAGVAGVYNRATYLSEKRTALTLWAERLMEIVEGRAARVVPIKRVS
jgi:integrase